MKKKILITGISGFVGSYLAEYLLSENKYQISGTYLSENSLQNINTIKDQLDLHQIDLNDPEKTYQLLQSVQPDFLFHLAALPVVGKSFENPSVTLTNNIVVQVNILEAVKKAQLNNCRILIVSSADVYGKVDAKDLPIDEDTPFMPTNTYAVSKIAQDYLALQYYLSYNMQIIRVRPFNHIGPRQADGFVIADFAKKIAEIEKGIHPPVLKVGNIEVKRDFTDVRDMVKAYTILMEKGKLGEAYNIGSGTSHVIREILDKMLSFSTTSISIEIDKQLIRPGDSPDRVCDNRKFTSLSGWKPEIQLEQTLKETLDYWRNIL